MKKLLSIVLVVAIAVSLCACGKVNQTMELITAIGTVTLDSEAAIAAAEEAYALLKEDQQLKVENYSALQEARSTYEHIANVANLIDSIGEVTLESEAAIVAAEEAYALLKENQQLQVKNYAALQEARNTYGRLTNAANLIDAIGEVTLESEAAITAAEEAYTALSTAEQALIKNYDLLPAARTAFDAKYEVFLDSLAAEWVPELSGYSTITLSRYDTPTETGLLGEWKFVHTHDTTAIEESGKWSVDRGTNVLHLKKGNLTVYVGTFIMEDGFIKLSTTDTKFGYYPMCFVRAQDFDAAFEQKFLAVELNGENYTEYLEDPVQAGYHLDSNGEPNKNAPAYVMKSKLYDQGYIFVGNSDDLILEVIRESNYNGLVSETQSLLNQDLFVPLTGGNVLAENWTLSAPRLGKETKGTAYFIKADYVADNYFDAQSGYTYVLTTSGALFRTGVFGQYTFNYEDYLR